MVDAVKAANTMSNDDKKTRMRGLGEFFGHIVRGIKTNPADEKKSTPHEVKRTVEEERREDGVVLRRTTIEEIEIPKGQDIPSVQESTDDGDRPETKDE